MPQALAAAFPGAQCARSSRWCRFSEPYCCPLMLDPSDPLFPRVGAAYVRHMRAAFGPEPPGRPTYYIADRCGRVLGHLPESPAHALPFRGAASGSSGSPTPPQPNPRPLPPRRSFNEMRPASSDPPYLSAMSSAVYAAIAAADSGAVWVMQAWLFFSDSAFWQPPQIKVGLRWMVRGAAADATRFSKPEGPCAAPGSQSGRPLPLLSLNHGHRRCCPTQALLDGVPRGRMLLLDLFADEHPVWARTEGFYGHPYIWVSAATPCLGPAAAACWQRRRTARMLRGSRRWLPHTSSSHGLRATKVYDPNYPSALVR